MAKRKMKLAFVGMMLTAVAALTSCESKPSADTAEKQPTAAAEATTPVVATAYRCPMRCEGSESNKPGKCPVCGMDLERNPDYKPTASTAATDSL